MIGFLKMWRSAEPAISEASPRDAAALAALHGLSFKRGWSEQEVEQLLLDRQVTAHRAMTGSKMHGFILSRRAADEAEILSVAVARSGRGRGLGHRLVHTHLRRLAGLGVHSVFLEVGENNTPATRLYARCGFETVSKRQNYYSGDGGERFDALVLRRDLG